MLSATVLVRPFSNCSRGKASSNYPVLFSAFAPQSNIVSVHLLKLKSSPQEHHSAQKHEWTIICVIEYHKTARKTMARCGLSASHCFSSRLAVRVHLFFAPRRMAQRSLSFVNFKLHIAHVLICQRLLSELTDTSKASLLPDIHEVLFKPAPKRCRSKRVWGIPNKHFASQNKHLYRQMHCLRPLCVPSVRNHFILSKFETAPIINIVST